MGFLGLGKSGGGSQKAAQQQQAQQTQRDQYAAIQQRQTADAAAMAQTQDYARQSAMMADQMRAAQLGAQNEKDALLQASKRASGGMFGAVSRGSFLGNVGGGPSGFLS